MQSIQCRDCPSKFDFTDDEAAWFRERGLNTPTRCKPCRQANKERQANRSSGVVQSPPPVVASVQEAPSVEEVSRGGGFAEGKKPPKKVRTRRDTRIRFDDYED